MKNTISFPHVSFIYLLHDIDMYITHHNTHHASERIQQEYFANLQK